VFSEHWLFATQQPLGGTAQAGSAQVLPATKVPEHWVDVVLSEHWLFATQQPGGKPQSGSFGTTSTLLPQPAIDATVH
jgi:hypothetical protein